MGEDTFTIDRMYAIMADVFMLGDFKLERWMSSADVPGWDSLHHVMLTMALEEATGVALSPDETARLFDAGSLYDYVSRQISSNTD